MIFRIKCTASLILLFINLVTIGQVKDSLNNEYILTEQIESVVNESNNGSNFQDILDLYNYLLQHPLHINTASKEELRNVFFFTESQIHNILSHRKIYTNIVDKNELLYLGFNHNQLKLIKPIISIDKNNPPNTKLLKQLSHQLLLRNSFILNQQQGYYDNSYLGNKHKLYARYRIQNRRLSIGFTVEKDAGEQLLHTSRYSDHKGFDFMSGHIRIAPNSIVKEIIIGDYSLNFGQGAILWSGFGTRKSALSLNVEKLGFSTRPYTSVGESSFFRGGLVKISHKSFDLFLFSSTRKLDANITQIDSITNTPIEFSSFQTSGFHRTKSELEDRKQIRQITNGGRIRYSTNKLTLASTVAMFNYNIPLTKGNKLYQAYDFEETQLLNYGIDFGYNFKNSRLFGEVASSSNNGFASIVGYQWQPNPSLKHIISVRNLSKEYFSPYGNIFSESGRTKNEIGLHNGFEWQITKRLTSSFYIDYFKYSKPTFSNNTPTKGTDFLSQFNYLINEKASLYLRFKHKHKNSSFTSDNKFSTSYTNTLNRLRLHFTYSPKENIALKTRAETFWGTEKEQSERGYLVYQDIKYRFKKLSLTGRLAQFSTSSFSSAIYAYEADVLYSFSVLPYYYQGSKYYLLVKYRINRNLSLWIKYSELIFDNKETIGSGSEQIKGNRKQTLKFQLEWKF